MYEVDALDVALLAALETNPRAGDLELSRLAKVARGTVQSRLRRLSENGIIRDWWPTIDPAAAGFTVQAFVTLEISQGALDEVTADLVTIPQVLEAYVTTGGADVLCKVATVSHSALQETLVRIDKSPSVVRSTSVIVLSTLVPLRTLPLLESRAAPQARHGSDH